LRQFRDRQRAERDATPGAAADLARGFE
jgi:hypothetical protein